MYRRELAYYFSSPIAYIVVGLYLVAISLLLWVIPGEWNVIESGYAQVDGLFQLSPWLLMLLCPALTMRLISEERQTGTWTLLLAQPISITRIVLIKYLAALTLTVIAIVPNIIHYLLVMIMAEPMGNIDFGQFVGSMIGLILLSASFTGVGLLLGSYTKSQLLAFVLGASGNFVLFWITMQSHYRSISRGVVDIRDIVFFLSIAALSVIFSILIADRSSRV